MALSWKPKFKANDIRAFVLKKIEVVENIVFDQLQQVGEQFVADARSLNTYKDRTSNLRGSIGYIIVKDGKEVFGNFDGTQEGQSTAKKLIRSVRASYPKGYALIVVAGMNYGLYVESKGYDVLTGSSLIAEDNLKGAFRRLQTALRKVK
ncbi:MAG TPA: hypothetical protein PL085_11555 [Agriterribacter sp.]|uniref:hypothetical protein n=1 Tax=Agriterribacter sp. TaxID=2821509 RepID=UPI002B8D32A3|nr:hypothetical protein [Agriterribacter sp.]HRQ17705.1 hypothetical protein [Agriterribacter sp.]